jgi:hypothetical protein
VTLQPISPMTREMLKAAAGRGVSNDPALLTRSKVRLLQSKSRMPKHGRGDPGLYSLPDESQTCIGKVRVVPGILYAILVEHDAADKPVGETFVLPNDAAKDGLRWRLPNGNVIDKEARLAGVFNGLDAELDLASTAMKTARAFNADAKARLKKFGLPLFGLAYEFRSQELNDGQYYGPIFDFLGAVGDEAGPSEEEILRAGALCDVAEATLTEARREAALLVGNHKPIQITSGKATIAPREPIDDDIPF